jgi:Dullard-like phosphatase family protein
MEYDKPHYYEKYPCLIKISEKNNEINEYNDSLYNNNDIPNFLHKKIKLNNSENNNHKFNEQKKIIKKKLLVENINPILIEKAHKKEYSIQIFQNEFIKLREKMKTIINLLNNEEVNQSTILSYIYFLWNFYFTEEINNKTLERLNNSINFILEDNYLEKVIEKHYKYFLFIVLLVYQCFKNTEIFSQSKIFIIKILFYQLKANYFLICKEFLKYGFIINKLENKLIKFFKFFKKNFTFKNPIYNLISLYNELEIKTFDQIKNYGEENIFFTQVTINISLLNNNENNKIDISIPYIKNPPLKKYSLVLDLDETLIHFSIKNSKEGELYLRPYLTDFLLSVSEIYEIIIFTAGMKDYANLVLNIIEKKIGKKIFDYRLFREHTIIDESQNHIKDLSKIGRDLKNILIVDNIAENFLYQPENGILISSFFKDKNSNFKKKDKCLLELKNLLIKISKEDIIDLRNEIKNNQDFINEKISQI